VVLSSSERKERPKDGLFNAGGTCFQLCEEEQRMDTQQYE
jgi:hypothetical protein